MNEVSKSKVFAEIDGVQTHVGYASAPDEGGARVTELFDQFRDVPLVNVSVEVADDTQVEPSEETAPAAEPVEGENALTISTPIEQPTGDSRRERRL